MKILFLIHRYPPALGGSERYIQEMARRLVCEGHTVTVYTSDQLDVEGFWQRGRPRLPAGRGNDEGVAVHRFRARRLPLHGATSRLLGLVPWAPIGQAMAPPGLVLPGLWRAVRGSGAFDLVLASAYPSLMYLGSVTARRAGARLVFMPCSHPGTVDPRAHHPPPIAHKLLRLYHQADTLIALTELEKQMFVAGGIPESKIRVTGVGVHPGAAVGANASRFRRHFGVPPGSPILAFVGHKTPGKGALHLLEMARTLLAGRREVRVVMAGAPTAVFLRRYQSLPGEVGERVLDLRLSEVEKHDLLAASTALLLPSREDAFGIVLLEAWLHGKAVIGARAGGMPAIIQDGRNGLLVPFGDVAALVQAVSWLLDHPDQASAMGAIGRKWTLEQWTWDAVYDRFRPILDDHAPGASQTQDGKAEGEGIPSGHQGPENPLGRKRLEARDESPEPGDPWGKNDPSWQGTERPKTGRRQHR
jgi:glycosyltransferase involved in cell wall biosynthesis